MAGIDDRIKSLGELFKEMQVTDVGGVNVVYVVVRFPERWIIEDGVEEKYEVSIREGSTTGEYYFCAELEIGFERVFDAIDHCIGVNKDAMERAQIFQEKLMELKEIFADGTTPIKKLKTLEFTFPRQKKDLPPSKMLVEEIADKETDNEIQEPPANNKEKKKGKK